MNININNIVQIDTQKIIKNLMESQNSWKNLNKSKRTLKLEFSEMNNRIRGLSRSLDNDKDKINMLNHKFNLKRNLLINELQKKEADIVKTMHQQIQDVTDKFLFDNKEINVIVETNSIINMKEGDKVRDITNEIILSILQDEE